MKNVCGLSHLSKQGMKIDIFQNMMKLRLISPQLSDECLKLQLRVLLYLVLCSFKFVFVKSFEICDIVNFSFWLGNL